MADGEAPEQSSKTEDPSQRKLEEAHKKGDVVKSQELTTWFMLAGSLLLISMMAPWTSVSLMDSFKTLIANADQYEVGGPAFGQFFGGLASAILTVAVVPLAILSIFAIAANLVQHRPLLSTDPITPKLSKVSPIDGFRRLFSTEAILNFVKGLAKIGLVAGIMVYVLWPERDRLEGMITAEPVVIVEIVQDLAIKLFGATLAIITVIAAGDFLYQRNKWWQRQKMTLQETRDEFKQMEGDPHVKARIRQLRMERSRKRMMASVPEATVVITNPTHFAVALKYDKSMPAPKCLAKGVDAVALRIRGVAEEHDVPIVENPPLARALFASVDVDETIPAEHFKAVAQVIGFVMRLRDRRGWRPNA
jgi:flagellar biosynthesis protein FlhB